MIALIIGNERSIKSAMTTAVHFPYIDSNEAPR
jgi:hypothetical protein